MPSGSRAARLAEPDPACISPGAAQSRRNMGASLQSTRGRSQAQRQLCPFDPRSGLTAVGSSVDVGTAKLRTLQGELG